MTENIPTLPAQPLQNRAITAPYRPRRFVPADVILTRLESIAALYQELLDRPLHSAAEVNRFIDDRCELDGAVDQQQSILYIGMTCQTSDCAAAEAYRQFISTIEPAIKPLEDQLNRKTLEALTRFQVEPDYFRAYLRNLQTDAELYRLENIPLQKQEALVKQEYQTLSGAMTVHFGGQEYTLPQMAVFLQTPDRSVRQQAWHTMSQRRLQDNATIESLFDRLRSLRSDIGRNANFGNYREYKFKEYHRYEYTATECQQFHEAIRRHAVPLYRDILARRREDMELATLRPWDLDVDPSGLPALKPFEQVDELIGGIRRIFEKLDFELASQFVNMDKEGLLDLGSRIGKAPGGYQCSLTEARKPFIFMNAAGSDRDPIVLLHEAGHAFHALACRDQRLLPYRHAPMEFCEVASMSMELLGRKYLGEFYPDPADLERFRRKQLQQVVHVLCWIATIDAFQHWLYENTGHNAAQRAEAWLQLHEAFIGAGVDWTGLEPFRRQLWHHQLHIFLYPFYYIEYGIAQLGALGIWKRSLADEKTALADYKKALELGSSVPLPVLFETAGIPFDFSAATVGPQMDIIRKELGL